MEEIDKPTTTVTSSLCTVDGTWCSGCSC